MSIVAVGAISSTFAANYTWTNGDADLLWNSTSNNWDAGSGNTPWLDNNEAIFGATGVGAITVSGPQTVNGLTTNANGFSLTGGQINLGAASTGFAINNDLTISSAIGGGANALTKTGGATLVLGGGLSNTFTGGITVNNGTVASKDGASLKNATGNITVDSGATFDARANFDGNTITNHFALSGTGSGILNHGALNIRENANLSGAITLGSATTITHDWNLATISGSITGTNTNLELVTMQSSQGGLTISAPISLGTGSLTLTGIGTTISPDFTLSNTNTYSGGTVFNGGKTEISSAAAFGSGNLSFSANSTLNTTATLTMNQSIGVNTGVTATLQANTGTTLTHNGTVTGLGNLTKAGNGTVTLNGGLANTLTGAINVQAGQLQSGSGASMKNMTGNITVASGATFDANQQFDGNPIGNNFSLSGAGSGISSRGALNLRGNANLTGTVTLDTDSTITHDFNFGTISGNVTGTNTNLQITTLDSGQAALVISGSIQLGLGGVTVTAAGGTNFVDFRGANTYTGATTITAGQLNLSLAGSLADTSAVNITGGTAIFDMSGITAGSETVGSLAGVSGSSVVLGAKNLTVGGDNTTTAFGGVLSGTGGSLTKTGAGTMTLSAANTYTGHTTVTSGTLILNSTGSIASTEIGFGVNNSAAGLITVENSSFAFSGTLSLSLGSVTASTGSWTLFNGSAFGAGDLNLSSLTSDLAGLSFTESSGVWSGTDLSLRTWEFTETNGLLTVVPEPSTWLLLTIGLSALVVFRRRRVS